MSRIDLVSKNLLANFFDVTVKLTFRAIVREFSCKIAKFYISPNFI